MRDLYQRYESARSFLPGNVSKRIYNAYIMPYWVNQGCFWYRVYTRRGFEFILVNIPQRERRPAFDHTHLATALSAALSKPVEPYRLPFEQITFSDDMTIIFFEADGQSWKWQDTTQTLLKHAPSSPMNECLSPDRRWAAYAHEHNLYLRDTAEGTVQRLTTDGVAGFGYGLEQSGSMTSLSDALANHPTPLSAQWSPDSRYLLTIRVDERSVLPMHLLQTVPPDGSLRPILHTYRMAMPNDEYLPILTYVIADRVTGRVITAQIPPQIGTGESLFYWARFGMTIPSVWQDDSRTAYIHTTSADQRHLALYAVDATSGQAQLLVEERSNTPIYFNTFRFDNPNYRVIQQGQKVIWFSERSGSAQLYMVDAANGEFQHRISSGRGVVRDVLSVDEARGVIYFTACGVEPQVDPYYRSLYAGALDGSGQIRLTPEDAEHLVNLSPDSNYFVDRFGRLDTPLQTVVRSIDGQILLTLEESDAADLHAQGWRPPKRFSAKGRDQHTEIYGALYLPTYADPQDTYPVIDLIYGGSQCTVAPVLFPIVTGSPVDANFELLLEDFWTPQAFAELGFAVVVIDGMGTPYRDRAFHEAALHIPGNAGGIDDHVAVLQQLAAQYTFLDLKQVGIAGHSAGGDNTLRAMLRHPTFFQVGVASSGSHDMRAYMAGSGLTDMGHTAASYDAYRNTALAANLRGRLLLITGDMDENCHPLHTMRVVDALIRANKDFDLLVLPNRNHGCTSDPYFIRRRWDYFVQHLRGEALSQPFEV